jgi:hypothetical protein
MGPSASRRRSGDVDELPPAEVDYSVRDRESTWAILMGNPAMGSDLALLTQVRERGQGNQAMGCSVGHFVLGSE